MAVFKKSKNWFLEYTFASRLVMRGVDLKTVQEFLGHKDMRILGSSLKTLSSLAVVKE